MAPYNHRLQVIGEEGLLEVREPWDYACPVSLRGVSRSRLKRFLERRFNGIGTTRTIAMARKPVMRPKRGEPTMDFARGVAELASAIRADRSSRLDADFAVHIAEVTEILQHPDRNERPAVVQSSFTPFAPMDWAQ